MLYDPLLYFHNRLINNKINKSKKFVLFSFCFKFYKVTVGFVINHSLE